MTVAPKARMAPRPASPTPQVVYAYTWLEATRSCSYRAASCLRRDDKEVQRRTVRKVLMTLVGAFERSEPIELGHARRVGELSGRLALEVGICAEEAEVVAQAGLLHDVGRLSNGSAQGGYGSSVLLHPIIGAQLVAPFSFLALVTPMIRHHHEQH